MNADDQAEIVKLLHESRERSRGYADFFQWAADRDLEEWGVVITLAESLTLRGDPFFGEVKSRGRPNDPPDCEAKDTNDQRIAIEVTELVDGLAITSTRKHWRSADQQIGPSGIERSFCPFLWRGLKRKT
jgi:hypothetical protein